MLALAAERRREYELFLDPEVITLVGISDETLIGSPSTISPWIILSSGPRLDKAKRAALDSCRLAIASEWWVAPLSQGEERPDSPYPQPRW